MPPKKKKAVASGCIKCLFQRHAVPQLEIQLAIAVGRVAELEEEVARLRLLVPVKKERYSMYCQTDSVPSIGRACETSVQSVDEACQTASSLVQSVNVSCETFTDTGTLIDGDEEDYQACLLPSEADHTMVEEDVEIVYEEDEEGGGDVLFAVDSLYPHFMGLTQRGNGGALSLRWLLEYCDELPFAYDEEDLREQSHWLLLLHFLEAREPFTRTLTVHQKYGGRKEWCVERRYHFYFSVSTTTGTG